MNKHLLSLLALALVIGCAPKDEAKTTGSTGETTPQTTGSTGTPEVPKPALSELPAEVKHEGFEYYGLGNTKPIDMELTAPKIAVQTGGFSAELEKIEGSTAEFKVLRTGALAETLGNDTMMVDKTGIYLIGTSIGKISPEKSMAMPAAPTPGKTWSVKNKIIRNNGQEMVEESTYKIEGVRDLKTKKGTEKALLVTSTGTATVTNAGKTVKSSHTSKYWYVKGVGTVQVEMTLKTPGEPVSSITLRRPN